MKTLLILFAMIALSGCSRIERTEVIQNGNETTVGECRIYKLWDNGHLFILSPNCHITSR